MKLTSETRGFKHLWWLCALLFCCNSQAWADSQDEVEDLAVCYAYGTDALGSAVNATIDSNLDSTFNLTDPQFAKGLGFYRNCFAKQFSFTLEFGGVPVLTVPDPATRTASTDAALQWANFVNNAFRGPGYRNTQHHMGSISSQIHGQNASMISYLIATHAFTAGGVSVVGGTYRDVVVRKNGKWLIAQRTLNITSSVVTPGSP
jgi:SnoaL-like domain